MVTDNQVRRLFRLMESEESLAVTASRAGMDEKTARKYRRLGKRPSEVRREHDWRTRVDPFAEVWAEIRSKLEVNPSLKAKTLFGDLQRRHVLFPAGAPPGVLCESDFTHMTALRITIQGRCFAHLIYHFGVPPTQWTGKSCATVR